MADEAPQAALMDSKELERLPTRERASSWGADELPVPPELQVSPSSPRTPPAVFEDELDDDEVEAQQESAVDAKSVDKHEPQDTEVELDLKEQLYFEDDVDFINTSSTSTSSWVSTAVPDDPHARQRSSTRLHTLFTAMAAAAPSNTLCRNLLKTSRKFHPCSVQGDTERLKALSSILCHTHPQCPADISKARCSHIHADLQSDQAILDSDSLPDTDCYMHVLKAFLDQQGPKYLSRVVYEPVLMPTATSSSSKPTIARVVSAAGNPPPQDVDDSLVNEEQEQGRALAIKLIYLLDHPMMTLASLQRRCTCHTLSSTTDRLSISVQKAKEVPRSDYVVYVISVTMDGKKWSKLKRYSQIKTFFDELRKLVPAGSSYFQPLKALFPGKTYTLHGKSWATVEKRREKFDEFFKCLSSDQYTAVHEWEYFRDWMDITKYAVSEQHISFSTHVRNMIRRITLVSESCVLSLLQVLMCDIFPSDDVTASAPKSLKDCMYRRLFKEELAIPLFFQALCKASLETRKRALESLMVTVVRSPHSALSILAFDNWQSFLRPFLLFTKAKPDDADVVNATTCTNLDELNTLALRLWVDLMLYHIEHVPSDMPLQELFDERRQRHADTELRRVQTMKSLANTVPNKAADEKKATAGAREQSHSVEDANIDPNLMERERYSSDPTAKGKGDKKKKLSKKFSFFARPLDAEELEEKWNNLLHFFPRQDMKAPLRNVREALAQSVLMLSDIPVDVTSEIPASMYLGTVAVPSPFPADTLPFPPHFIAQRLLCALVHRTAKFRSKMVMDYKLPLWENFFWLMKYSREFVFVSLRPDQYSRKVKIKAALHMNDTPQTDAAILGSSASPYTTPIKGVKTPSASPQAQHKRVPSDFNPPPPPLPPPAGDTATLKPHHRNQSLESLTSPESLCIFSTVKSMKLVFSHSSIAALQRDLKLLDDCFAVLQSFKFSSMLTTPDAQQVQAQDKWQKKGIRHTKFFSEACPLMRKAVEQLLASCNTDIAVPPPTATAVSS